MWTVAKYNPVRLHLRETEELKEKGNVYYREGNLRNAEACYNQVLNNLANETSWSGLEEVEKSALIFAAHLNLAACKLWLSDYTKVIEHCNQALKISQANYKAYFRRGMAYQGQNAFDLASKDYQHVLTMEPENALLRKQIETCMQMLKKKGEEEMMVNAVSRVIILDDIKDGDPYEATEMDGSDQSEIPEELDSDEYSETEVGFESGQKLCERMKQCKKNPDHVDFIRVEEFDVAMLPPSYHYSYMVSLINELAKLTVLVRVLGKSSQRPKVFPGTNTRYPFSGIMYKNKSWLGSGWICAVNIIYPELGKIRYCPCSNCQSSKEPRSTFAEILVCTATHVVFDLHEGKNTTCYLCHDSDDSDYKSCPQYSHAVSVHSSTMCDLSLLTFIDHNIDFAKLLKSVCVHVDLLRARIKSSRKSELYLDPHFDLADRISTLYQEWCDMMTQIMEKIDIMIGILNDDLPQDLVDCKTKQDMTHYDRWLCEILEDKQAGGNKGQVHYENLCKFYSDGSFYMSSVTQLKDECKDLLTDEKSKENALKRFATFQEQLDKIMHFFKFYTDDPPLNEECFNSSHSLTIIISHPHGCSQRVTLGEVIERELVGENKRYTRYRYTNPTCPGSSGARVFILGREGFTDFAHSKFNSVQSHTVGIQLNESAIFADF